jgi:hypothetical protein
MHEQLLNEIEAGQGKPLSQLARLCPATRRLCDVDGEGKPIEGTETLRPVSMACLLRWVIEGAQLDDGSRVKLEAVRLANKWISSAGALRRFIQAQTPRLDDDTPVSVRTPAQRKRAADRADQVLDAAGI